MYLTVASIGQKVLAFAYFLLLARLLQPEKTGLYAVALSLATTFSVIADFGTPSVVIRDVAKDPVHSLSLVRQAFAFKLPLTLFAIIASNATAYLLGYEPDARLLVALAGGILFLDSLSIFFYGVLRGLHVLAYESLGMFVGQLMTLVGGALALWLHPTLPVLILTLTLGSLFNAAYASCQVVRRLGMRALMPQWTKSGFRHIAKAAFPFFLAAGFVKLFGSLDVQFLKFFQGNAAVGVYSVAYKFTYAFQFLPLAFVAALYPSMSALVGNKDMAGLERLFEKSMRYMLLLSIPLAFGISFIADQAVGLVGSTYGAAIPVLSFLPFVLIPSFLDFPIGSLLNASGRQGTKTALFGATLAVNFLLNLYAVPRYGMMGAAGASVFSIVFLVLGGLHFVPGIIRGYRHARLIRIAFPFVFAGMAMRLMGHAARIGLDRWTTMSPRIELMLVVCASACTYAVTLWLTRAVSAHDVRGFTRLFRRTSPAYAQDAPVDA